jgi:hypothetical protein
MAVIIARFSSAVAERRYGRLVRAVSGPVPIFTMPYRTAARVPICHDEIPYSARGCQRVMVGLARGGLRKFSCVTGKMFALKAARLLPTPAEIRS